MKKLKELCLFAVVCIMALCFMTACGGGGNSTYAAKSAYEKQQIEEIDKQRQSIGQNKLTWDKQMDEWAAELLDAWVAYQTDQLTKEEYSAKVDQVKKKYDGVMKINGKAVTYVSATAYTGEIEASQYKGLTIVTENAAYIGNATKTADGEMYGVVVIAT